MAEGKSISTTAGQLKMLRQQKESLLKEWDVSFSINGEVLLNVLSFMNDINTEIPIKFYPDRIFMHQKSADNIQYAELEISSQDVMDYKPNLEGDPNRRDAKSILKGPEGEFKGILVDLKGIEEIQAFAQKDDIIEIRVDTTYYKRIEIHCPSSVIMWAQLLEPTALIKSLERLPETIRRVRNNPEIKKASVIIEPQTFNRICSIGGKGGKKRDIDERVFIELDKKDGLFVSSGDRLKGKIFALKPIDIVSQLEDYGGGGFDRGGVDRGGFDRGGFDRGGFDRGGFDNVNINEETYEGEIMEGLEEVDMLKTGIGEITGMGEITGIGEIDGAGSVEKI